MTCISDGTYGDNLSLLLYAAAVNAQAALQKAESALQHAVSGDTGGDDAEPQSSPEAVPAASPPPEDPKKEKAKDRRARQQQEAREEKAERLGGEPDTGGAPRSADAQNSQFNDLAKSHNLTLEEADRLHKEITKQNLSRSEVAERIWEMFGK